MHPENGNSALFWRSATKPCFRRKDERQQQQIVRKNSVPKLISATARTQFANFHNFSVNILMRVQKYCGKKSRQLQIFRQWVCESRPKFVNSTNKRSRPRIRALLSPLLLNPLPKPDATFPMTKKPKVFHSTERSRFRMQVVESRFFGISVIRATLIQPKKRTDIWR